MGRGMHLCELAVGYLILEEVYDVPQIDVIVIVDYVSLQDILEANQCLERNRYTSEYIITHCPTSQHPPHLVAQTRRSPVQSQPTISL